MDNEFKELLAEAKKLYTDNPVISIYEKFYGSYNIDELKNNLRKAIKRKKTER